MAAPLWFRSRPKTHAPSASRWLAASLALGVMLAANGPAAAAAAKAAPPVADAAYRGRIHYPDFAGRDRAYAMFRTRIRNEMRSGPNFAGRYAIVQIGCGAGCLMVFVADVATGEVFDFPYSGENYQWLTLTFTVAEPRVDVRWLVDDDTCMKDTLRWDGGQFASTNKRVIGDISACRGP